MTAECILCERVKLAESGELPQLIHEFEHTYLVVGDHQFHRGYCVLLLKSHVREMHDLEPDVQLAVMSEVFTAGAFIEQHYNSWKINYSCLGNSAPHVHWHIFPRYDSDPDRKLFPWLHFKQFQDANLSAEEHRALASKLKTSLDEFLAKRGS